VDASARKRGLRAEVMRKLEIDVDCAADIVEARGWWKADFYDLVLIDMEKDDGPRDRFCDDVRGAKPGQRLAFLVGEPEYLANSPRDQGQLIQGTDDQSLIGAEKAAGYAGMSGPPQRWGILEACRRISAVRTTWPARTRAMQAIPAPPRDSDGRASKRILTPITLDDLLREEAQ